MSSTTRLSVGQLWEGSDSFGRPREIVAYDSDQDGTTWIIFDMPPWRGLTSYRRGYTQTMSAFVDWVRESGAVLTEAARGRGEGVTSEASEDRRAEEPHQ